MRADGMAKLEASYADVVPAPLATLKLIAPGTLPTPSALVLCARAMDTTPRDALDLLRGLMRRGRVDDARRMLNALGWDWTESKADCPKCHASDGCMCAEVDALAGCVASANEVLP